MYILCCKDDLTYFFPLKELEKLVEQSYVRGLAVCDFNKNALEQLCKTAKV